MYFKYYQRKFIQKKYYQHKLKYINKISAKYFPFQSSNRSMQRCNHDCSCGHLSNRYFVVVVSVVTTIQKLFLVISVYHFWYMFD